MCADVPQRLETLAKPLFSYFMIYDGYVCSSDF